MRKQPSPPPPEGSKPPPPPAPPRLDGRPPRSYPLQAPTTVMIKLGSIAVHVEEYLSPAGHVLDFVALRSLLDDPEIKEWLAAMDKLALVPRRRT